jgi:hypothetical protein
MLIENKIQRVVMEWECSVINKIKKRLSIRKNCLTSLWLYNRKDIV